MEETESPFFVISLAYHEGGMAVLGMSRVTVWNQSQGTGHGEDLSSCAQPRAGSGPGQHRLPLGPPLALVGRKAFTHLLPLELGMEREEDILL